MFSKIPRHEIAIVIRLFLFCLLAGSSYTLAKTAADSLFLSRIGAGSLPAEFLAAGVATALFATLWVRAAKSVSIGRLLRATAAILAVFYITAWVMLPMMDHSFSLLSVIYVLAEIKGCLYAIVAISAMNETLGRNSSRQSWATILLGFSLAAITVGATIGFESTLWDADNWLLVAGILDLLAILTGVGLKSADAKRKAQRVKSAHRLTGEAGGKKGLPSTAAPFDPATADQSNEREARGDQSGHGSHGSHGDQSDQSDHNDEDAEPLGARIAKQSLPLTKYADAEAFAMWFSVLIAAKVMVLTLVAFNWKVSVNEYLGSSERLLASYFGWFYAMAGLGTLLVQFFVTARLLSNKSVVVPILVLPAALLLLNVLFISGSGLGMSLAFTFYITTGAKAMDAWRRSTHDTAIHLLYTSIEKRKRRGLIGHNHGLIKPGSEIAAGLVLVTSSVWFQQTALLAASVIWIFATLAITGLLRRLKKAAGKKKRPT